MIPNPPASRQHTLAAALALIVGGAAITLGLLFCHRLETRYIHALAPEFFDEKLQGMALQKEAFAHPDLLVFYGSSELVKPMDENPAEFFEEYPTGFRVFAVGKAGAASLALLQKIAAVGPDIKGRKLAYSISPGYFFHEAFDPKYYEGNFSVLQASELAFSPHLSRGLKRDVARRMLSFPKTLDGEWLLETALHLVAGDSAWDSSLYALLQPLGFLNNAIGRAQDHFETLLHVLDEDENLNVVSKRGLRVLNWSRLLRGKADAVAAVVQAKRNQAKRIRPKASRDKSFIETVARAKEWTDAELLLRTMKELGARPLLLCMPLEDLRLEAGGLTPPARDAFVERLRALAQRYEFPLLSFREHEKDPGFLADFADHLSAKGWLYYNQALDDFYHGRQLTSERAGEERSPQP